MHDTYVTALARRVSARLTRRAGLGLIAASLPLLASDVTDAKKKKVTLCVNGQTVRNPKKKAKKLLKQGATKGACPGGCASGQKLCGGACIPATACCVDNDCTGDNVCENSACVPPRCGNGGPCVVFVSPSILGSILGGPRGADNTCNFSTVLIPELRDRPFKAWISGSGQTPATRFTSTAKAGPYVLVGNAQDNGAPPPRIADSFQDLISCNENGPEACLKHPINRLANGKVDADPFVWTATAVNGSADPDNCGEWQVSDSLGLVGKSDSTDPSWTAALTQPCDTFAGVYCFEQPT